MEGRSLWRDPVLRALLVGAAAAVAVSVLLPWATFDGHGAATRTFRPGWPGLVLVAVSLAVIVLATVPTGRVRTAGTFQVGLGAVATILSVVLALRAISRANGVTASMSTTSYSYGAPIAIAASIALTVVAAVTMRSAAHRAPAGVRVEERTDDVPKSTR